MEDKDRKKSAKNIHLNSTKLGILLLAIVALIGVGASVYMYMEMQSIKNDPKTLQQAQQSKVNAIKDKVGKLIAIPKDETPVLATVDDKEKLKDQPFFKDAQNGDVILMFAQSKKAIIYRESENKLVNVGPIAITSENTSQATPAE